MSVKSRIAQLNTRLADTLTEKGVQADGGETTTALIDKVAEIPQGGGVDLWQYVKNPPAFDVNMQDVTEDITMHLERASSISNMFSGVAFGCEKLTLYISESCTSFYRALRLGGGDCKLKEIEIVGDTSKVNNYGQVFFNKMNVERIGTLDFSSVTQVANVAEAFTGCKSLKEIRFVAGTLSWSISFKDSERLSVASLQSIIDGLADLTGGTSQVLSLHINTKSQMTDEQIAAVTGKNWTIA